MLCTIYKINCKVSILIRNKTNILNNNKVFAVRALDIQIRITGNLTVFFFVSTSYVFPVCIVLVARGRWCVPC